MPTRVDMYSPPRRAMSDEVKFAGVLGLSVVLVVAIVAAVYIVGEVMESRQKVESHIHLCGG